MIDSKVNEPRKETAIRALQHLNDSASYEQMMYELYLLQKVEKGREDLRIGNVVTHEAARERIGKWLK